LSRLVLILFLSAVGCAVIRRPAPPNDRSEDDRIRREVEARLAAEPSLRATPLRVDVQAGMVLLYGSVAGSAALRCAVRNAELVSGVQLVVEYLVIERGPAETRCLMPRNEESSAPVPGGPPASVAPIGSASLPSNGGRS
jgi:hypothetical protein